MMNEQFTPGPWRQRGNFIYANGDVDGLDVEGCIVSCEQTTQHDVDGRTWCIAGEPNANARLIAASPDLLEAAKLGLSIAEGWIIDQLEGTSSFKEEMAKLQPIRDAIAKAELSKAP